MPRKSTKSLLKLPEQPRPLHKCPASLRADAITVALAGCGGNGAQMLTKLARLHYALCEGGRHGLHVHVFDPDTVSRSNVGRQLFSPSDVGTHKSVILTNRLNAFYGLSWEAYTVRYPGSIPGLFQDSHTAPDILITCVDTAKARRDIFQLFAKRECGGPRYWLDLGNMKLAGQVILGEPLENAAFRFGAVSAPRPGQPLLAKSLLPRLPHVIDLFPEILNPRRKEDDTPTCSLADALDRQSLFVGDAISTYAAQLLDDLLRVGEIAAHGYYVNLETGITRGITIPAECATPVPQETVEEPLQQRVRMRAA